MELAKVGTPSNLFDDTDRRTIEEIGRYLTRELNSSDRWSPACSDILMKNPRCLFLYDCWEYALGKAYGNILYKILLNPCMKARKSMLSYCAVHFSYTFHTQMHITSPKTHRSNWVFNAVEISSSA